MSIKQLSLNEMACISGVMRKPTTPVSESMGYFLGKHALKALTTFGPVFAAYYFSPRINTLETGVLPLGEECVEKRMRLCKQTGSSLGSGIFAAIGGAAFVYNYIV